MCHKLSITVLARQADVKEVSSSATLILSLTRPCHSIDYLTTEPLSSHMQGICIAQNFLEDYSLSSPAATFVCF